MRTVTVPASIVVAIASTAMVACGDDDLATDGSVDAGDTSDATAPFAPAEPAPPALPVFAPCPAGWRAPTSTDLACEPWPDGAPTTACADHEARFVGDAACARLGSACPADGVPTDVPITALHVRAGAAAGGDGSRDAPFATIAEALSVALDDAVIAIHAGEYDETLAPARAVTLVGACVEATVLRSSSPSTSAGVVTPTAGHVTLRNLRIGPSERSGVWAAGGAVSITLADVAIHDVTLAGLDVEAGATLDAERVVIRRTRLTPSGLFGRGMTIETGARVTVRRATVEGATEFGVVAVLEGTRLVVEDTWIADVAQRANGSRGVGLAALGGAALEARAVVVTGAQEMGVLVADANTVADLEHLVVRDITGLDVDSGPTFGRGLNTQVGARVTCRRCLVERVHDTGMFVGDHATATFEDIVLRDIDPMPVGSFGRGIAVQMTSTVDVSRLWARRLHDSVAVADGSGTSLSLRDIDAAEIAEWRNGAFGRGIGVQAGAAAVLERARLVELHEMGLSAIGEGTTLIASDVVIDGVATRSLDGRFGRGLLSQDGASLSIVRGRISDTHDVGVVAIVGGMLDATDLTVLGVDAPDCGAPAGCLGGHGLGVYEGGAARIASFSLSGSALCGVHVALGGTAMLAHGEVRDAMIGACVQSDAQALADLQNDVRYVNNGRNLESTMLPVPPPLMAAM